MKVGFVHKPQNELKWKAASFVSLCLAISVFCP